MRSYISTINYAMLFLATKPINELVEIKYYENCNCFNIRPYHHLIDANGSAHLSFYPFVTGSQAGRNFMQILIFLTKAKKRTNGLFIRCIYISSTKHSWLPVTFYAFFFYFFFVPYTRSLSFTISLTRSPVSSFSFSNFLRADSWPSTFGL